MGLGEGQGAASLGECWSTDPDLANRDPNNLNDHLAVSIQISSTQTTKFHYKFISSTHKSWLWFETIGGLNGGSAGAPLPKL